MVESDSPGRQSHMRQSKMNHSILQKRYREDEDENAKELQISGKKDQIHSDQAYVEQKGCKRRIVQNGKND